MAEGKRLIEGLDDRLTVVTRDRPGLFSRVAAVLALNGLDVLDAAAYSNDDGHGAARSSASRAAHGPTIRWDRVVRDLERALDGRLALEARLRERARVYAARDPLAASRRPSRRSRSTTTSRPWRR